MRLSEPDARHGYVLDGFPRNLRQAERAFAFARELGVTLDAAVHLELPEEELLARIASRARSQDRSDDTEETVRHRLRVYAEQTRPLEDYYAGRGVLHRVDGVGTVAEVTDRILAVLEPLRRR